MLNQNEMNIYLDRTFSYKSLQKKGNTNTMLELISDRLNIRKHHHMFLINKTASMVYKKTFSRLRILLNATEILALQFLTQKELLLKCFF